MSTSWREQLAWAAGFYDGEGCCSFSNGKRAYRVSIVQIDPEVLLKFQAAVLGIGTLQGPYKTASMGNSRPRWQYTATGADAQAVIAMLWPWLGTVKREQARERLVNGTFRVVWRGDPKTTDHLRVCKRGHTFLNNRTKAGACRECMRMFDRARADMRNAARKVERAANPKPRGRPRNPVV